MTGVLSKSGLSQHEDLDDNQIFIPTIIWLVGNVVTDLITTIVFTTYLARLKRGTTKSTTGSFAAALIRLALETCAIPLCITLFSTVVRSISTISGNLAYVGLYAFALLCGTPQRAGVSKYISRSMAPRSKIP